MQVLRAEGVQQREVGFFGNDLIVRREALG
jgi:hypothetical protein